MIERPIQAESPVPLLIDLVSSNERWLMRRVLDYAKRFGYTRYASTLEEAWRISIAGLSDSLIASLRKHPEPRELSPDEDYARDPVAAFGIAEARLHRSRGITLAMFLGLTKYYRQSYIDLVGEGRFEPLLADLCRLYIRRFFDRVEIGFCSEWASLEGATALAEMQQASRTLANEKTLYLTVFESLPDPAFFIDETGDIHDLNLAAAVFLGLESNPGRRYYSDRKMPPTPEWLAAEIAALPATGRSDRWTEKEIITHEGLRRVEIRIHPMLDVSEKNQGSMVIIVDVTEKRRLEDEVIKTGKLESVGVLAGGIAHDFNNILTGILGNISLAQLRLSAHDPLQANLAEMDKACARARQLTNQFLTFAKGGDPVKRTAFLGETLRETAQFVLHGSKVRAEIDIPEGVPAVEIDVGQISQVIQNLVLNAQEAMPEGGTVHISLAEREVTEHSSLPLAPGRYVEVTVRDEGPGIPAAIASRIFDPYFTTKSKGHGLGLPTAHSIVRRHGGALIADPPAGGGAVFRVLLPATDAAPAKAPPSDRPAFTPHERQKRVLVMDDEEGIRAIAEEMLSFAGFEVVATADGEEALARFVEARRGDNPFAAVLMDLTVPGGMGGKALMEKLLAIDPRAVGIVSSGYSNDPVMANFREHGFRAAVGKPYRIEELCHTVEKALAD